MKNKGRKKRGEINEVKKSICNGGEGELEKLGRKKGYGPGRQNPSENGIMADANRWERGRETI